MGSLNVPENEVLSCSSPGQVSERQNGYMSEGDTTLYSAETAESRNYPIPKEGRLGQLQVGRSQSCVNYNRWGGPVQASPVVRGRSVEKRRSYTHGRKVFATLHRGNDYYSPTVSSIMKNRNNLEWRNRSLRPSAVHSSQKWAF
ncbi:hypothetical protein L1987_77350 [Smallanthus sonchifolius]|uniref:Uncharacterized protein n=1 Tax=Smallanthus sonchifolius TaxID=185202 RepID=A0ACB8Z9K2_9ASTR|nr:hypothetical protein L1987_77350 [Smallanthus sonchifolius]